MNIWWTVMVIVGSVNLLAALFLFFRSFSWSKLDPEYSRYISILRICGIVFASVALYRSIFVSSYPDRLAWFDSLFNSPFVVRSLALFAEMSFIGMIALVLRNLNKEMQLTGPVLAKAPAVAVICIFIAQFFAFGGLITQSNTQFAIEEALWAVAFIAFFPLSIIGLKKSWKLETVSKGCKAFFLVMTIWCTGYLAFQLFFALPFMYIAAIPQDIGRVVPPDAFMQSIFNFTATRDFDTWGGIGFFIWHSGYFSVCVWMVLLFMTAPRRKLAIGGKTAESALSS